jgi:hypothetical protein
MNSAQLYHFLSRKARIVCKDFVAIYAPARRPVPLIASSMLALDALGCVFHQLVF